MDERALLAIVLFPLVGAILNGFFGQRASRDTVQWVACLSVLMSFGLAVVSFVQLYGVHDADGPNVALSYTAYEWFSVTIGEQRIPVQVRFVMDSLSAVMTLVVTGIGFLIHLYSCGYMSEEKSYARFFAYLNLFTASMLILVLGSNLPLMFVGWEGVGLCSYLLIGFWWDNPAYAAAGRKAFVANRIGDFGVLIGIFLLVTAVGSFEFSDINAAAADLQRGIRLGPLAIDSVTVATAATMFLFLGCTGKSAQIPLFVWLPDAMAGPTPVSALIHAATMVTSGLYLICRLSHVFAVAPWTMAVIAVIGAATAFLAATIGCVQNDIKKVLAYSTVSQLGFMFAAAGCGAFAASFMHVYTHAFFKACLFLGAGSVMHAVGAHGDADIRRLGGLRQYMPRTHWTFAVSCAAIAGVPLFSGFFSKDEILVGALSVGDYMPVPGLGLLVFAVLLVAATMTAFYMFRLYFMTFWGAYRGGPEHHGDDAHAHHGDPHESPDSMTIPLVVLGLGAVFAGYVWVGAAHLVHVDWASWVEWLKPSLGEIAGHHEHSGLVIGGAMVGGIAAAAVGIGVAYAWYAIPGGSVAPTRLAAQFPRLHAFVFDKWRVDELYEGTILALSRLLGTASAGFDKVAVDGGLTKVPAYAVQGLGFLFTRLQNGLVHAYAAAMVGGMAVIGFWFIFPHAVIETPDEPAGTTVDMVAGAGLGYEYRWDFDSDGEPDTGWQTEVAASYTFVDDDFEPGMVVTVEPDGYNARLYSRHLDTGDRFDLSMGDCGPWQVAPEDDTPPNFEATAEGLRVKPNGARVRVGGRTLGADEEVVVRRGEHLDVGSARLTVSGVARTTLRVRNAFGVERASSVEHVLPVAKKRPEVQVLGALGGVQ